MVAELWDLRWHLVPDGRLTCGVVAASRSPESFLDDLELNIAKQTLQIMNSTSASSSASNSNYKASSPSGGAKQEVNSSSSTTNKDGASSSPVASSTEEENSSKPRLTYDKVKEDWQAKFKSLGSYGPFYAVDPEYDPEKKKTYEERRKVAEELWSAHKKWVDNYYQSLKAKDPKRAKKSKAYAKSLKSKAKAQDHKDAYSIFMDENNNRHCKKNSRAYFNLHGQHVKPAKRMLKYRIQSAHQSKSFHEFEVVTGKGGGDHGTPVIKNETIRILDENHIQHEHPKESDGEVNEGVICFSIDGSEDLVLSNPPSSGSDFE
ncbi:unnamed protein product [Lactuca virosa]|uniref:Smr domain-containing protein n=1 Tax=Lactuca virosa TaxID=75947 RepID=A0AAU9MED3_9ASTR|nr:unnamed protein product [Lactuca virosa]